MCCLPSRISILCLPVGDGFYAGRPRAPPLFIDRCGSCDLPDLDDVDFGLSLERWYALYVVSFCRACVRLGQTYEERLLAVNITRAQRIRNEIITEVKVGEEKKKATLSVIELQRLNDGYTTLQERWPDHIAVLETSTVTAVAKLLSKQRHRGDVWNGDLEPVPDIGTCTVSTLKSMLRFFQQRQVEKGIVLGGLLAELKVRVTRLVQKYHRILWKPE